MYSIHINMHLKSCFCVTFKNLGLILEVLRHIVIIFYVLGGIFVISMVWGYIYHFGSFRDY